MTARCTVCGRKWIIAVEQDKPGYICPSCEMRKRLTEIGILKGDVQTWITRKKYALCLESRQLTSLSRIAHV